MKLASVFFCLFFFVSCVKKKIDSECCSHPPTQVAFDGGYLTIPNIFTPDGDGVADWLVFQSEGLTSFHIEIKNNLGTILYTTTDTTSYWEGRKGTKPKVKHGIYNYQVTATGIDGTMIDQKGVICVVSSYRGNCIANADKCVFESKWDGNSFVTTPTTDEFHPCP